MIELRDYYADVGPFRKLPEILQVERFVVQGELGLLVEMLRDIKNKLVDSFIASVCKPKIGAGFHAVDGFYSLHQTLKHSHPVCEFHARLLLTFGGIGLFGFLFELFGEYFHSIAEGLEVGGGFWSLQFFQRFDLVLLELYPRFVDFVERPKADNQYTSYHCLGNERKDLHCLVEGHNPRSLLVGLGGVYHTEAA